MKTLPAIMIVAAIPAAGQLSLREAVRLAGEQYPSVKASLQDVKAGRVKRGSAADLIKELGLDD